jgi:uncharacterized protein (UPF0218 family)
MAVVYSVTPELRLKLRKPFGTLIQGSFVQTMDKLEVIVKRKKPPKIVSVGDAVSQNLHAYKIYPKLSITDNKCMRKQLKTEAFEGKKVVRVKNPQGTITEEAIAAIRDALESDGYFHIIVDGEEDLLALIAVLYAPETSLVVYGQPYEGIVVIEVTPEKKKDAGEILNAMKTVRKAK